MTAGPAVPDTPAIKSRERLWLALAPALIYTFAYTFEVGYANRFGIPHDLIRLDLERILAVGGSLTGLLSTVWFVFLLTPISARGARVVLGRLMFPGAMGIVT